MVPKDVWAYDESVSYTHLDVYKRQVLVFPQERVVEVADTPAANGKGGIKGTADFHR